MLPSRCHYHCAARITHTAAHLINGNLHLCCAAYTLQTRDLHLYRHYRPPLRRTRCAPAGRTLGDGRANDEKSAAWQNDEELMNSVGDKRHINVRLVLHFLPRAVAAAFRVLLQRRLRLCLLRVPRVFFLLARIVFAFVAVRRALYRFLCVCHLYVLYNILLLRAFAIDRLVCGRCHNAHKYRLRS